MLLTLLNNLALLLTTLLIFAQSLLGIEPTLTLPVLVMLGVLLLLRLLSVVRDRALRHWPALLLALAYAFVIGLIDTPEVAALLPVFVLASGLRDDSLLLRGLGLATLALAVAVIIDAAFSAPPQVSAEVSALAVYLTLGAGLVLLLTGDSRYPTRERFGWAITLAVIGAALIFTYEWFAWVIVGVGALLMTLIQRRSLDTWVGLLMLPLGAALGLLGVNLITAETAYEPQGAIVQSIPAADKVGLNLTAFTNRVADSANVVDAGITDLAISLTQRAAIVINAHPAQLSQVIYPLSLPAGAGAWVDFNIAQRDTRQPLWFGIAAQPADGSDEREIVFTYQHNPDSNDADASWRRFIVDISQYAGQAVNLTLLNSSASAETLQAVWGSLRVVTAAEEAVELSGARPASLLTDEVLLTRFGLRTPIPGADVALRRAAWAQSWQAAQQELILGTGADFASIADYPERSNDLLYRLQANGAVGLVAYLMLLMTLAIYGISTGGHGAASWAMTLVVALLVAYGFWQSVTVWQPAFEFMLWLLLGLALSRLQRSPSAR